MRGGRGRGGRGGRALSCLDHSAPTPRAWQSPGVPGFSLSPPSSFGLLQGPRGSVPAAPGAAGAALAGA